jgi:hypothetical protein
LASLTSASSVGCAARLVPLDLVHVNLRGIGQALLGVAVGLAELDQREENMGGSKRMMVPILYPTQTHPSGWMPPLRSINKQVSAAVVN